MQYCHYVAGLVGIGLSQLFAGSGLESAEVGRDQQLANSMGLFLQKTNIIRDYLEDMREGRQFWPRQVHTHTHKQTHILTHSLTHLQCRGLVYCKCFMYDIKLWICVSCCVPSRRGGSLQLSCQTSQSQAGGSEL